MNENEIMVTVTQKRYEELIKAEERCRTLLDRAKTGEYLQTEDIIITLAGFEELKKYKASKIEK